MSLGNMSLGNTARRVARALRLFAQSKFWDDAESELAARRLLFEQIRPFASQVTCERDGLVWTVATDDVGIGKKIFVKGTYQQDDVVAVLSYLRENGRISGERTIAVDIGANIGIPALPIARSTELNVLAVEPVPAAFELLVRNVRDNGLEDRIRCVQAAILEEPGTVDMVVRGSIWGFSEVRVAGARQGFGAVDEHCHVVPVRAERLDAILAREELDPGQVAFVWSDTQGREADVISSGVGLWRRGVPLFVEIWPHGLDVHGTIEGFLSIVEKHFSGMITKDVLLRERARARPMAIRELESLVTSVGSRGTRDGGHTDVLLIP